MNATMETPKLGKPTVELINRIWDQLERIFGQKARDPEFLKNYITVSDTSQPDGRRLKNHHDLVGKLLELKEVNKVKADDRE
ncbi:MAG: hypothetical protein Q7S83_04160 [bacterium]|nr:hypothetical protein [bacterium]